MSLASVVPDVTRLADLVGREVSSAWFDIPQETISSFAEVTRDRQWIHIDAERARNESPHGTTIAHGFLTLSLVSRLMSDAVRYETRPRMAINYGLNRVRFPAPLPAGSRVRGRFVLLRVDRVDDAYHAAWSVTVEREGSVKPCCVAEWLVRYYP